MYRLLAILCLPLSGLLLGLLLGLQSAYAIDFKVRGLWQLGVGAGVNHLANRASGKKIAQPISDDTFKARNRIRLWIDAVASENLSGSMAFEIGHLRWGQASSGSALGTDGQQVKLWRAHLDWTVPQTDIKFRMGLQNINLPSAAGGSNVFGNVEMAAITASWQINENYGITAMWGRPYNDNYSGRNGYLDNIDVFMLGLPIHYDNIDISPWFIYGIQGRNAFRVDDDNGNFSDYRFTSGDGGNMVAYLSSVPFGRTNLERGDSKPYGSLFWAGLPVKVQLDAWNFELEFNYGFAESMGRYTVEKSHRGTPYATQRADTRREGWLVKALAEYKTDNWGTPGIYGWYASGDDGDLSNGSERMPFFYAETYFTSIMGDDTCLYGGIGGNDRSQSYDGTWGIGLRWKDISFIENLTHMLRATYIQGTNSPEMVKYSAYLSEGVQDPSLGWQGLSGAMDYYLTTRDSLLEINFHNVIDVYENLKVGIEFSYMVNMLDKDVWKRAGNTTFSRTDMWVADLTFFYSF